MVPNAVVANCNVPAPPLIPIVEFAVKGSSSNAPVPVMEPALPLKVMVSAWIVKLFAAAASVLLSVTPEPVNTVGALKVTAPV